MVGFAVTSFFVSFAWLDPIYVLAAFLTGLYVSKRVELEQDGTGRDATPVRLLPPGWRVTRSAWRCQVRDQTRVGTG